MKLRGLLLFGVAMPVVYLITLTGSALLFAGYAPFSQPPSVLGGPDAPIPLVYNVGMVLTAFTGVVGGFGLALGLPAMRRDRALAILGWASGLCLVAGSAGLGMAGLFPLPDPRHYGFGLTILAAFVPLLGAIALWRARRASVAALVLLCAFVAMVGMVVSGSPPLITGLVMMLSDSLLALVTYRRLNPRALQRN